MFSLSYSPSFSCVFIPCLSIFMLGGATFLQGQFFSRGQRLQEALVHISNSFPFSFNAAWSLNALKCSGHCRAANACGACQVNTRGTSPQDCGGWVLILWPAQSFYFGLSSLVKRLGLSVVLGVLAGWESILEKLFMSQSLFVGDVVLLCSRWRSSCASRSLCCYPSPLLLLLWESSLMPPTGWSQSHSSLLATIPEQISFFIQHPRHLWYLATLGYTAITHRLTMYRLSW